MKRRIAVTLLLGLVFSVGVWAQQDSVQKSKRIMNHAKMMKILETSLHSEYAGIVEATTYNLVGYRDRYPEVDFSKMVNSLEAIARESKDSTISYKAHLVGMYLRYGADVRVQWPQDWSDHDNVFRQIAEQLEKKFLLSTATP